MSRSEQVPDPPGTSPFESRQLAGVVGKNIGAIVKMRAKEERKKSLQDRIADVLTIFSGSMAFVYVHTVWFGLWIAFNLGWFRRAPFDPFPFSLLTLIVSLEAIFLSTFVLISQNRAGSIADKRADLDLQINLLAEHEITHLLKMVDAIAVHLGIDAKTGKEIEDLKKDIGAEQVLDEIETREKSEQGKTSDHSVNERQ
ncbi:MAG TPA: DUF1003 domain-containing protein [Blastocatellia bacterium]|nr:DUF1003 domain-containing protein [Blastocatellia bacterium]